jgi:hypothetical protein
MGRPLFGLVIGRVGLDIGHPVHEQVSPLAALIKGPARHSLSWAWVCPGMGRAMHGADWA